MTFVFYFLIAVISGILYRMGGSGLYQTMVRDLGVPTLMIFPLWPVNWLAYFFAFCATFGISTAGYGGEGEPEEDQSHLYRIFGEYVFFVVGFIFGLALLPMAIATQHWPGFFLRMAILIIGLPIIEAKARPIWRWDRAQVTEWCRGFLINITCNFI